MLKEFKPSTTSTITWEEDYAQRCNPTLINRLLHQAVPVLKACEWGLTKVERGFAESLLPLNRATTNQHGTHQAALISLSADYTGGMALTTLLTGTPLSGIHRCQPQESASLWLVSMNVKYLAPSTGHLIGRCTVSPEEQEMISRRYAQGKRVLVTLPIEFESNGQVVATAELAYFAQPTIQLLEPGKKSSTLFSQKLKASARMIAGVRASRYWQVNDQKFRLDAGHSAIAAGPQGEMLAERLKSALPQLVDMVLARTQHGDDLLSSISNLKQIVLVGAGLDVRPFRLRREFPETTFFELDLPEMLAERERVAQLFPEKSTVERVLIATDFLQDDVSELLWGNSKFDPQQPTAFVYEGCSMYFERSINVRLLQQLRRLALHPESRLWMDVVSESVVGGQVEFPEVQAFLDRMDQLGEKFIFGCDRNRELLQESGWECAAETDIGSYWRHRPEIANDPVMKQYRFVVAKPHLRLN